MDFLKENGRLFKKEESEQEEEVMDSLFGEAEK